MQFIALTEGENDQKLYAGIITKLAFENKLKLKSKTEENKGMLGRFWRWRKLDNFSMNICKLVLASGIFAIGMSLFTILCQNL